ncbi:hypothetical protein GF352_05095 [archaeon]|nr:hypothetical protein [archaeon]
MSFKFPIGIGGPPAIGKTFLARFFAGEESLNLVYERTVKFNKIVRPVSLNNDSFKINDQEVKAMIWDFGGQSIYQEYIKTLIHVGGAFVYGVDSTDPGTIDKLVEEWFPLVRESFEDVGKDIPPATLYISKILTGNSLVEIINEQGEMDSKNAINSDFIKEVFSKTKGQKIYAQFMGDTVGNKELNLGPVMYAIKGPRGVFNPPFKVDVKSPISIGCMYGLQEQGITNLFDETNYNYLKEKNLILQQV